MDNTNRSAFITYRETAYLALIAACCLSFWVGCEETFQPVREDDSYPFSIYGYLDASIDTQWVRVTPPRPQITARPIIPEMQVTLEEIGTGNRAVMGDSLFQLPNGINFVNSWTTMDVKPEHTYRIIAENLEGETSSVIVTTPADFPIPDISYFAPDGCEANVYYTDIKNVADVQWVWTYENREDSSDKVEVRYPYRNHILGGRRILLSNKKYEMNVPLPGDNYILISKHVYIASAGPEWIEDIDKLSDVEFGLPDGVSSNVENGAGYVVGILSKTMPYEYCPPEFNF